MATNRIAGHVSWKNDAIGDRLEQAIAEIFARRAGVKPLIQRTAHAVFFQSAAIAAAPDGTTLYAADARLDNGPEMAAGLGIGSPASDEDLVRDVFLKQGDAGLASLLGAFAFVHWDEPARRLTMVRDCLGRRSLFYYSGDGFVVFASYLPDLLAQPLVPRQVDEIVLAKYLSADSCFRERTPYRGIDRVEARSRVELTPAGTTRQYYWSLAFDRPPPYRREEDYIARARELFDRAVARTLRDTPRVAVMMSGGLDSSAVAATAARLGHADVTCYTAVPPEDVETRTERNRYASERPKVEALARMHPALRVKFVTPRGMHPAYADSARCFSRIGYPVWCPVHQGWIDTVDDEIRVDAHNVVLDGMLGNFGLSWTGDLSLVALARQLRWIELFRQARAIAKEHKRPLRGILRSELVRPLVSERLAQWIAHRRNHEAMPQFSLINPEAVAVLDMRRHWQDDDYNPRRTGFGSPTPQRRARVLFDNIPAGRDMMAASPFITGHEKRDPHCDRELLAFCLSVPETLYRRDGISRWFARQVFSDRLPPEIVNEQRRGLQCSNWFEAFNARKPVVEAAIEDFEISPLVSLLIDIPRLKRLVSEWPRNTSEANARMTDFRFALERAVHAGEFIRWVERGCGQSAYGS